MNYLFVAVQKEAERSEEFGSREEAREYFEKELPKLRHWQKG